MHSELINFIINVIFMVIGISMILVSFLWRWWDPKRDRTIKELFQKIFHITAK